MLGAEYGFLGVNRLALERHRAGNATEPSEAQFKEFRKPYAQPKDAVAGAIESIRNAFFEIHRRVLRELADVTDAELEKPATFWENKPMPIRFRLHRFEEHLRQHTIQLDKTLAVIRPPTEAHRLVRNIYNALAEVESVTEPAEDLRSELAATISERAGVIGA
jgi:hypothetical protein